MEDSGVRRRKSIADIYDQKRRINNALVEKYRNRILSSPANQRMLAEGRMTMNTVDSNARLSAKIDDMSSRVNNAADRYVTNAQRYLARRGIDATQQGFDWSPQQRIGVPRSAYMGSSNG